ncbi:MAG: aldehyde dehydrogenase (NADP(+)) [Marinoscillum sp.]|uniref:aldehyde dehydrogenase (NADP(+)) n=1 Tax=Marinoscillum sp. TaxID=2024838 RepID=UPI003302A8AA
MILTGQNFIGSERTGVGSETFQAMNPATGDLLPTSFYEATEAEVDRAVLRAEAVFQEYKEMAVEDRALFLEAIGDELFAMGDNLIDRCIAETALPAARLNGERMRTINQLKMFASLIREGSWVDARIDTAIPDRQPLPRPDIRQMHIPLGPVGIFGASNFPLAFSVAGGDTASALAAGCPVVVKAHPLHPGTSEMVAQAIVSAAHKTGMPDGVFSMVQGTSVDVGMAIVLHPKITAVGFTGSFRGGKALFDAANKRETPIPVFAEMGSSNPVFLLPGAVSERAEALAAGLIGSLNMGVGQFCTNPGLLIVNDSPETSELLKKMGDMVSETVPGTMLSEGIRNNYETGVSKLMSFQGVELVSEGTSGSGENQVHSKVFKTKANHFIEHSELEEEVFGPSTLSVIAEGKAEMLEIARKMQGHLTATIQGTDADLDAYKDLIHILERKVGRLLFNGYPTGVEVGQAMVHGGPYPATTAPQSTSVGTGAIKRFVRPVCYQDFPQTSLPLALRDDNPLNLWRLINGELKKK